MGKLIESIKAKIIRALGGYTTYGEKPIIVRRATVEPTVFMTTLSGVMDENELHGPQVRQLKEAVCKKLAEEMFLSGAFTVEVDTREGMRRSEYEYKHCLRNVEARAIAKVIMPVKDSDLRGQA